MIVSQLNRTELHRIDSIKMTLNRLTMMLCDDSESIESNRITSYRFDQDDVEPIDHESVESNRIASHRFEQGDVESIDHDALR